MSRSQDNIDSHDRTFVKRHYSPSSRSTAVIRFVADRGLPIVAIVVSAIAITVVLLDRQDRDERFERALRESDARWIQALNDQTARWVATHHELDTKWQDSMRKSDIQWQESFRRSDVQWSQSYKELERENRLAQKQLDDMRVEMLRVGLNPQPHMAGESR